MRRTLAIFLLLGGLIGCNRPDGTDAEAGSARPETAPSAAASRRLGGAEIALLGLDDATRRPLEQGKPGEIAVFVFLYPDCPIANAYAPELRRLRAHFATRPVTWHFVHADRAVTPDAARAHADEFGLREAGRELGPARIWIDRDHDAVRALGATVTPEAAVLRRDAGAWRLDYRGRIDDLFVDFGQRRARASTAELREAIERSLAGEVSELVTSRAVGCYIETEAR